MAAPVLRIPISASLEGFRKEMDNAVTTTSATVSKIGSEFLKLNAKYAPQIAEHLAKSNNAVAREGAKLVATSANIAADFLRPWVAVGIRMAAMPLLRAGLVAGLVLAVGAAVAKMQEQFEKLLQIAEKAEALRFSPRFFQSFVAAAEGSTDVIKTLESALESFSKATKPEFDAGVSSDEPEQLKRKWNEVEQAIRSAREVLPSNATGPTSFIAATNEDERARAALQTIKEFFDVGKKIEGLEIAKGFGPDFHNAVLTGRIEIEKIITLLDEKLKSGVEIFDNESFERAKELDRELTKAWNTLRTNLNPAVEAFNQLSFSVKSVWIEIVKLLGQGAALLPSFPKAMSTELGKLQQEEKNLQNTIRNAYGSGQRDKAQADLAGVQARIAAISAAAAPAAAITETGVFDPNAPLPRRRRIDIPTPAKKEETAKEDPLESSADRILKRAAALEAEAQNIDKGTEARERARVSAELETLAIQLNTKAGLENTAVTADQREVIDKAAEAWGKAALAMEQANGPLRTFARDAANLNRQLQEAAVQGLRGLEDGLISIINGTKSVKEAFKEMATSILNDLARIAIRQAITGPLAGALGFAIPGRMAGGPVSSGSPYWVGESGPELFVPGQSGQIIPHNMAKSGVGTPSVTVISHNSFATGVTPTDMAAISQMVDTKDAQNRQAVIGDIRRGQSNDSRFLG